MVARADRSALICSKLQIAPIPGWMKSHKMQTLKSLHQTPKPSEVFMKNKVVDSQNKVADYNDAVLWINYSEDNLWFSHNV